MQATAVCRFTAFAAMGESDLIALSRLANGRRRVARGEFVCHEGDRPAGLYLLLKGWTASSLSFAGGSRQLLKIHLPGDMLGLPSLALRHCADSIVALTEVDLAIVARRDLGALFERSPRLAALLFLISQEERVAAMDRLASVGATDAARRLAAMLLHIHARLQRSDDTVGDAFDLPLTQEDVAALVGITPAHLSRVLLKFRTARLLTWTRHRIALIDRVGLAALSGLPVRELDRDADWLPA